MITLLPAVTADTAAVAPEDAPVIISEVENAEPGAPVITTLIGLVVLIILPVAPEDEPVISSPLVKVPVVFVHVPPAGEMWTSDKLVEAVSYFIGRWVEEL